jgi:predicted N-acetyltransferase YhbS
LIVAMFAIRHEVPADTLAVEALLDRCFGSDRRRKASYRYRVDVPPLADLCFVAEDEAGQLVGAIRYWPLWLSRHPALLLGPLAIDPDRQGRGIGRALVFHSLETAAVGGHRLVFLVGDPAYYRRFGFALAPAGIVMPGEQPSRLNYRLLDGERCLPQGGTLRPVRRGTAGPTSPASPEAAPRSGGAKVKAIAAAAAIH